MHLKSVVDWLCPAGTIQISFCRFFYFASMFLSAWTKAYILKGKKILEQRIKVLLLPLSDRCRRLTHEPPNSFKTGKKNLNNYLVFQSFLKPKQIVETLESGKYHLEVSVSLVLISLLDDLLNQRPYLHFSFFNLKESQFW